jgi:drug/metabolite transporter (DMT)-like permease
MASLLALLSSALWGSADFQAGNLSKRFPAIAVLGTTQAIGLLTGIFLVVINDEWSAPAFGTGGYFFSGICAGLFGYAGLICLYAGLSTGRMGVVSPISALSALIPFSYAVLIKDNKLSTIVLIGAILAIAGGFFTSGPELSQGLPLRPILLALGAALGFGGALIAMAIGSEGSALATMTMMRATTFIPSLFLFLKFRSIGGLGKKQLPQLLFIGIADFLANLLLGVATTKGILALAMVLGALYPVATVLLAFFILHERLHKVQYIGITCAVVGVAIISTF